MSENAKEMILKTLRNYKPSSDDIDRFAVAVKEKSEAFRKAEREQVSATSRARGKFYGL